MAAVALHTLKVLLADDAPNMRRTVRSMLRSLGISNITVADDGDTAWNILNSSEIGPNVDLIICDWHMPKLPGLDLLRRVRDNSSLREIPFLMITAEVTESRIAQAAETEVDGYLLKPFMLKTLEEKMIQILVKKENPSPFELHMRKGQALLETDHFDGALAQFAKAIDIKPDSARARQALGEVYMKTGAEDKAEKWLLEAARANPQYIRAHETLAEFYKEQGKDDRALKYMENAAEISPHNPNRQVEIGEIYLKKGDGAKADQAFKKALESNSKDAEMHTEIGEIYLAGGDANKAAAAFKNSLDIVESVHVYNRLGIALRRKGRHKEAITEYHKALKVDEKDEAIYFNMGRAYMEMKDFKQAQTALNKAMKIDPDFSECKELLVKLKEEMKP